MIWKCSVGVCGSEWECVGVMWECVGVLWECVGVMWEWSLSLHRARFELHNPYWSKIIVFSIEGNLKQHTRSSSAIPEGIFIVQTVSQNVKNNEKTIKNGLEFDQRTMYREAGSDEVLWSTINGKLTTILVTHNLHCVHFSSIWICGSVWECVGVQRRLHKSLILNFF